MIVQACFSKWKQLDLGDLNICSITNQCMVVAWAHAFAPACSVSRQYWIANSFPIDKLREVSSWFLPTSGKSSFHLARLTGHSHIKQLEIQVMSCDYKQRSLDFLAYLVAYCRTCHVLLMIVTRYSCYQTLFFWGNSYLVGSFNPISKY